MISGSQDSFIEGGFDALFDSAKGEKEKLVLETDHFFEGFEGIMAKRIRDFFCSSGIIQRDTQ